MSYKVVFKRLKTFIRGLFLLSRLDLEVRKYIDDFEGNEFKKYSIAMKKYRNIRILHFIIRILLYASIVTTVSYIVGFGELVIIEKIATYIGTTLLLAIYLILDYIAMIRKETYLLKREILISKNN